MYSFGNSVHMDPDSEQSKAERARHSATAEEWERAWAGIDSEVEKAKEEEREQKRKEAMRALVMHDEEELEKEGDTVSEDQTTEFESTILCLIHGNHCHCHEDGEHSSNMTRENVDVETDEEDTVFFDCSTSLVGSVVSEDETSRLDPIPEEQEEDPFAALALFFNAKVNDSDGRYTEADYYAEIKGIVLETFCGWLEDLRISYPDAESLAMRNRHRDCPHLGAWEKTLGCPECEICGLWMPIYILTCPSCGAKACARCKFVGRAV